MVGREGEGGRERERERERERGKEWEIQRGRKEGIGTRYLNKRERMIT